MLSLAIKAAQEADAAVAAAGAAAAHGRGALAAKLAALQAEAMAAYANQDYAGARSKLVEVLTRCAKPAIVFVNAKKQADVVGRDLEHKGMSCVVLHGGKDQSDREGALAAFKAGEYEILLATDVAGRGLDIPDVATVVNYDMPSEIDKYQHRIGRTGRAGKTGRAITLLTDEDQGVMSDLKAYLEATGQTVPTELANRASGKEPRDRVQYAKK